ncbi:MAG TPA: enoyl-CoA hydratase/isomerase family protein [Gemmatimonadales bacterium]|nr:enoyl-CoA hydratase/isomerase family protein [Gemmatimonadales bacterium]
MTATTVASSAGRAFGPRAAETFAFRDVLYTKGDHVARITINRPANYNAYSTAALEELATAFRDATFDDGVGVIVLTGAGDRAFCTGGDVKEYAAAYVPTPRDYWKYMALFRAYIESILNTGKPVIARINGMAVGGGNESQLACDLSVMAQHAYLKQVGTHVGSVACGGATQWLPLLVGDKRAREMLFLNEPVPADKALAWGLVNWVVPSVRRGDAWIDAATPEQVRAAQRREDGYCIDLSRLDAQVDDVARRLLASFVECTRYTKQQTNFLKDFIWHSTVRHAQDWLALHYASWEPVEGMQAFVEKRAPRYAMLRDRAARGEATESPWGAPVRSCSRCGVGNLPAEHHWCGACGAPLS